MADAREQKNEVFKANGVANVDPRIQQISAADKVRQDFGLDIPVESMPLPSMGIIYPESSPLYNVSTIELKAMTAREEDILTCKAYLKKGTVITELIKSCLIDKRVDPRDMLVGDRNALMVAIRITGYGEAYDVEMECPECKLKSQRTFDLSQLPIKRLELPPVTAGDNLFEFQLPVSKKRVQFRFLTGRDEEEILTVSEKQKKMGIQVETSVTTNLAYSVVSIDGITDKNKIKQFINMMPARDSLELRKHISQNEPGILMRQETSCQCGYSEEVNIPLGVTFLWPNAGQ